MSKKMKGVSFDPSGYRSYESAKAKFKHQSLLQDYADLQKDTEAMRSKLETMKLRKKTLLAEVRFLLRRHKVLTKNKSMETSKRRIQTAPPYTETHKVVNHKARSQAKTAATMLSMPPKIRLSLKGSASTDKKHFLANGSPVPDSKCRGKEPMPQKQTQVSGLNRKERICPETEARIWDPTFDWSRLERVRCADGAILRNPYHDFDLSRKGSTSGVKEVATQSRARIFDLNQLSGEEDRREGKELISFKEPNRTLQVGGGVEEQQSDLKMSACRSTADGSASRKGKRKISWQDPVALKV